MEHKEILMNWLGKQHGFWSTDTPVKCIICKNWIKGFPLTKKSTMCINCFILQLMDIASKESKKDLFTKIDEIIKSCITRGKIPIAFEESKFKKEYDKLKIGELLDVTKT